MGDARKLQMESLAMNNSLSKVIHWMGVHRHQTLLKERSVSLNSAIKITQTEAQKEKETRPLQKKITGKLLQY